jgi:hypothetical protein
MCAVGDIAVEVQLLCSVRRTILLVDLCLDVEVDTGNDQVGDNIERAHAVEDVLVIERDLLGDLHEPSVRMLEPIVCASAA